MIIDFTTDIDVNKVRDKLDDYLTYTENGERWAKQLYFTKAREMFYLEPFLERALEDICVPVSSYDIDDWWTCAVISVDYFREAFCIEEPVEVVRAIDNRMIDSLGYCFGFDYELRLFCSEIVIADSMQQFHKGIPPVQNLVGGMAHECWHAHQINWTLNFLRREQGILNLEEIDPTDPANRGALYALGNTPLLHDTPTNYDVRYRVQMFEAEACHMQHQICLHLAS